jgi:TonB family protein
LNERKHPLIAPDEDSAALNSVRFSLASDIVELVVLTSDELFLQTLREAVGGERRLWHVGSADKVSDLLVAGEVGILVLDVQAMQEIPSVFIAQIKRQFPDLVVVVAGNRDIENSLAGLISAGTIYRFIHKPMSPGRAKLFADAAVKKFGEQRKRAAAAPPVRRSAGSNRGMLTVAAVGILCIVLLAVWAIQHNSAREPPPAVGTAGPAAADSPLLARAAAALAANRLVEPAGDNALELYLQAQASNPADAAARAGLAEVRERLLASAENALLEERLDEAAAAIETARKSGVEGARIAFLSAQLAKSREQVRAAQAAARARSEAKSDADKTTPVLSLVAQRLNDGRVIEPDGDSALFYVREAQKLDPNNAAVQESARTLSMRLLTEARSAIDHRDFTHASAWIESAKGIASPANIEALDGLLTSARHQAQADAWAQLLKNATDRLQQDRLVEPANDSAKYYLLTLRGSDPGNSGLAAALQDLGTRLLAKARRALALEQYDAARSWLDEAAGVGFGGADLTAAQHDLEAATAKQQQSANVVAAGELKLIKSVNPAYPQRAEINKTEGWVELDFTVAETGKVQDIALHAASVQGVFDQAAITALAQWSYQPVLRDDKPVPQRARIRIRFVLAK